MNSTVQAHRTNQVCGSYLIRGHHFWNEAMLLTLPNAFLGALNATREVSSSSVILKRRLMDNRPFKTHILYFPILWAKIWKLRTSVGKTKTVLRDDPPRMARRWPSRVCRMTLLISITDLPRNCSQAYPSSSFSVITFTWCQCGQTSSAEHTSTNTGTNTNTKQTKRKKHRWVWHTNKQSPHISLLCSL